MLRIALVVLLASSPKVTADLSGDLAKASQTYDLESARAIVVALENFPGDENPELRARARLLVAELLRIDFEFLSEDQTKERRALGKGIDTEANAGLDVVDTLSETSEKYRLKADLLGTKIRSNYRAGKYKGEMNRAIDEALRINPLNVRAHVSKAKTWILRPDADPDDLRRGLALLDKALELDSELEQAHLLRAHAYEKRGELKRARKVYQQCLDDIPECLPAIRGLARLKE